VRKHGLKSHIEYKSYAEKEELEKNPENKYGIYWKGWYDFLGIDKSIFIPTLEEWREKVKKLNIQTVTGYNESCNFNELNNNLPLYPKEIYIKFSSLYNEFKVIYPSYTERR
jgi:hypothetical protein